MILEREQINRYLRHILIPEVSGPGQKKLLASSVFICGENVAGAAAAIYYLAAAGVGRIDCRFDDAGGFEALASGIQDLNPDVSLKLSDGSHSEFRIFLGRPDYISGKRALLATNFAPSVIALYHAWKGGRVIVHDSVCLHSFLSSLQAVQQQPCPAFHDNAVDGELFSRCVLGALSALEVIKLILGIGCSNIDFLSFDLFAMEFRKGGEAELSRMLNELCAPMPAGCPETTLAGRKVLIVGAGGLGSPAAYALSLAGIGTIGIVDCDTVEISNLNRQILHTMSRLGMAKVDSAAVFLKRINPQLIVNRYNTSLSQDNVAAIIADYDVVIAAVDNFPTRFLLSDACFFAGTPLVDAGAIRFDGTFRTILPRQGPCYRCVFPALPAAESIPSCAESGVIGPIPGIMGFMQAAEAVKLLSGCGNVASDRMIFFDGMFSDFCTIKLSRNSACPLCGVTPL